MRGVKIALAAGLALLVLALGLELAHSPMSVAHANGVPSEEDRIVTTDRGASYCQARELLPRGTTAIRLSMLAFLGPRLRVVVYSGGRAVTSGERGSGWATRVVTVAVRPLSRTIADATVCVSFHMRDETLTVFGYSTAAKIAAHDGREALPGRMWIEYLHPGTRSWASLVGSILRNAGFGRAASGFGIVLLAILLLAGVCVLAARLVLEELA
jgi:hypothetical protein